MKENTEVFIKASKDVGLEVNMCVCVPMLTHCTIMCFGFHARWIDGVEYGLFSNHTPLGQTTLRVGRVSV